MAVSRPTIARETSRHGSATRFKTKDLKIGILETPTKFRLVNDDLYPAVATI
jgi:hypothetical protein